MNLIGPFLYGIGTGFLMSVLLGVVFFMLIQAGLKHHWKKGITIASGVIAGDIIYVVLAIGFTGYISMFLRDHQNSISLIGGLVLCIMGISTFLSTRKIHEDAGQMSKMRHASDFFIKPFFINLLNPANAAWWLGLYSIPPAVGYDMPAKIAFAAGAVGTVFFTEIGVAAGASRLKKYITESTLKKVDLTVGAVLVLFGLRLLLKGAGIWA